MNIPIFLFLLFSLQGLYWFVGKRASKNIQGQEDYFLAGKNVRLFPLMMTFLATQVGGGVILGAADEAYRFGWPVFLYPMGGALGLILLGSGIGRKLAQFQVSTIAEIFEKVYRSTVLRKIASILSILSLFMVLVAQIIASSKFLVSLGLVNTPLFILFWGIVIFYTAQGGLKAVISTDLVQALFFSAIFMISFALVFTSNPHVNQLQWPSLTQFVPVSSKLSGWLLMPLLFMVIEQDMGQRCFAGASPKVVSKASFLAGVASLIICFVPVFFGTLASAMNLPVPKGGSVLMALIAQTTNPWIAALVGCAVLAAIISTATSLINAISSNISSDFKLSPLGGKGSLKKAQWMTALLSIAAIFFAFYFDNIVDVLIQSYELTVSCLFIPITLALFKKSGHTPSAWLSFIFGAIGFILFRLWPVPIPKEIATVLLSLVGFGWGLLFKHSRSSLQAHV